MQMVILAGGLASRMRPMSELAACPLVAVDDRPFLAYQLDLLRANGIRRVVLCIGRRSHDVRAYFRDGASFGVEIAYSEDGPHLLGTAGALRKARPLLDDVFFVMYGDTYVVLQYPRIWTYFHRFDRLGLAVVGHGQEVETPAEEVSVEEGLVTRCRPVFGGPAPAPSGGSAVAKKPPKMLYHTGVSVLRREALSLVPPVGHRDLVTLFDQLARQRQLLALRTEMRLYSIATLAGLRQFRQYLAAMSA
jgi:NDP-sugar pyrophosphorylase family protein